MTAPLLAELEARRARLFERLAPVGDFRRGSISENYRKCGKPNCACAQPGHCGHRPRWLWTRTVPGRGTTGRQLAAGEVEKVRGELARFQEFAALSEQIVEVSEAICEARAAAAAQAGQVFRRGQKGTLRRAPGGRRRGSAAGRGGSSWPGPRRGPRGGRAGAACWGAVRCWRHRGQAPRMTASTSCSSCRTWYNVIPAQGLLGPS